METSPLTKELYSIDWATRFEQYQKYEKANFDDLYSLLSKIEETVEKNLNNKNDLDTIVGLRTRLDSAKPESPEWHYLSMLINFRTVKAALGKGLTATATLSAIQIMGHMWKSLELDPTVIKLPSASPAAEKTSPARKASPANTASKENNRPKTKAKSTGSTTKTRKTSREESAKAKPAAKQNRRKENPVTENVVIKKLTAETGSEDDKPLAIRCHDVANNLADEYPQYTLTAIRVMTAEKLGVTRQYVENLDIKPARFK